MYTEEVYQLVTSQMQRGWLLKEKLEWMEAACLSLKGQSDIVAVEIGVFYGMSAIAQGLLMQKHGLDAKLYAIDAFSPDAAMKGENSAANNEWWAALDYREMYNSFIASITHFGLQDIIIPCVGDSIEMASEIPNGVSLLHQDGNHSKSVVSLEIETYVPKMKNNSWWIADDFKWVEMGMATDNLTKHGYSRHYSYNHEGRSFAVYTR